MFWVQGPLLPRQLFIAFSLLLGAVLACREKRVARSGVLLSAFTFHL
jgi:hypothetical protein